MQLTKYLFEIPQPLKDWTNGYSSQWRTQIINTFLTLAYHWDEGKVVDLRQLFIEIYYQEYIDPLETDFDEIPDEQFYRDQISFYMRLQEEFKLIAKDGTIENILRSLRKQWMPYMVGNDFYTELLNSRKYFVYQ